MTDTAAPPSSNDLLPARGQVLLPVDTGAAQQAMEEYLAITRAVLVDDDYQSVGRGRFVKRSGFQKLANFYTLSTHIVSERSDRDPEGRLQRHRAVVRATHPSGRYAEGDGACSIDEPRFKSSEGRGKVDHDLPATAVTRATNRAISNLVGFGQISAEEASADEAGGDASGSGEVPVSLPAWAQPVGDVPAVADALIDVLKDVAGPNAAIHVSKLGQAIFDECDNEMPRCVASLIFHLREVTAASGGVAGPASPAEGSGGQDPAAGSPPDPAPAEAANGEETP